MLIEKENYMLNELSVSIFIDVLLIALMFLPENMKVGVYVLCLMGILYILCKKNENEKIRKIYIFMVSFVIPMIFISIPIVLIQLFSHSTGPEIPENCSMINTFLISCKGGTSLNGQCLQVGSIFILYPILSFITFLVSNILNHTVWISYRISVTIYFVFWLLSLFMTKVLISLYRIAFSI